MIVVVICWNLPFICGSKHHFHSQSSCGTNLSDAPPCFTTCTERYALHSKNKTILQLFHYHLPVRVLSHKHLPNKPCPPVIYRCFDHSFCFIPKIQNVKSQGKFEKTTTTCMIPNAWEQSGNRRTHLGAGMHSHVSPKRALLIVTANVCHFSQEKTEKTITGHVYRATLWPTRCQSCTGADTAALSGAHSGHVWNAKLGGHRPKIRVTTRK